MVRIGRGFDTLARQQSKLSEQGIAKARTKTENAFAFLTRKVLGEEVRWSDALKQIRKTQNFERNLKLSTALRIFLRARIPEVRLFDLFAAIAIMRDVAKAVPEDCKGWLHFFKWCHEESDVAFSVFYELFLYRIVASSRDQERTKSFAKFCSFLSDPQSEEQEDVDFIFSPEEMVAIMDALKMHPSKLSAITSNPIPLIGEGVPVPHTEGHLLGLTYDMTAELERRKLYNLLEG